MSEIIIKVDHIRKTYRSYKSNFQKLKHMLLLSGAGEKNRILKDISFEVHKGEKLAVFSNSGGGKSTLIHIIAGIIKPESGSVEIKETPALMLDFRMGVEPSLSAHDNYEMRAKLMGWSQKQIKEREKEVFRLAGLLHMHDMPIRDCPKGATSRLGFIMSTMDKADFILFDEKMTYGSSKMNAKFLERFSELITPEVTLVMAANDLKNTGRFCERGIVIDDGIITFDGPFEEAFKYHKEHPSRKTAKSTVIVSEEPADEDDVDDII